MAEYICHSCSLRFFIGPDRGGTGWVCAECGTQHRLRRADWLVFKNGPEFRKVSLEDRALYLQRAAEEKLRNAKRAAEVEERRAVSRKEWAARSTSGKTPLPALQINLLASRRRYFPRSRSDWRMVWIRFEDRILPILFFPITFPVAVFWGIYDVLPAGKKRSAEIQRHRDEHKVWVARSNAEWELGLGERWHILPISALTEQKPLVEMLEVDRFDWHNVVPLTWEETFRLWFDGVTCGHCAAKGTLRCTWDTSHCPLCKQESIVVIPDSSFTQAFLD